MSAPTPAQVAAAGTRRPPPDRAEILARLRGFPIDVEAARESLATREAMAAQLRSSVFQDRRALVRALRAHGLDNREVADLLGIPRREVGSLAAPS